MTRLTIQRAFELALQHHEAGRLREAEQLYQQILAQQPNHAGALHYLGVTAGQSGHKDIAVELIRRAIALNPNYAAAHSNLGNTLKDRGLIDEAIAAYRQAIALNPNLAEAHTNLGDALRDAGQFDEAIAAYRQAIALNPNLAGAHNNLGNALKNNGMLDEAIAAYRQALILDPDLPEAHSNLGDALRDQGQFDQAILACRRAIALRPDFPDAHSNLGVALNDKGLIDEAIAAHRRAVALKPNYATAHSNLGNALKDNGRLDEAIAAYHQAIAVSPAYAQAHNNLGVALKESGRLDQAIAAHRQAITLDPHNAAIDSNQIFALHFHPAYDARAISDELCRWNRQHAARLTSASSVLAHCNVRNPDRRLRIGYVSPDFRQHVVGRHLLPLFQQHDRRQFEFICYAQVPRPDAMTSQLQQNADAWRNIVGLSDDHVARQIQGDQIDILVDLALHTASNRLLVFARKPAPVQVTWLGYCGSSGMSAIDYRLSDPHFDPPDTDLSCYCEKTVRLPRTYWCYQPDAAPDPSPAPALKNGFVTFGCLNNFAKVSHATLDLWARILLAVPNSHMIIHAPPGKHIDEVVRRMQKAAVEHHRLHFIDNQPWAGYVQAYSQIDIALDPFPYGGGITTCDALWMGVPVVSLSGQTAVGRGGRSILSNLGLPELIAFTPDRYMQIAIELARNVDRSAGLRQGMRDRMLASPLMDAEGFARDVEAAYRQMWHAWCRAVPDEN